MKTEVPPIVPFDIQAARRNNINTAKDFETKHPLDKQGYSAVEETVPTRDGHTIHVKIYRPLKPEDTVLPLLFVTHGGGFFQGSYVTEENFILRPIWLSFDLIIISVDYRYSPEHRFPTQIDDSWDALEWALRDPSRLGFDPQRVILAGSSAGGTMAASLSTLARDATLPIKGVFLSVPVLCHPDYFPKDRYEFTSYDQCFGTLLNSAEMRQVFELYLHDQAQGADPRVSPLLNQLHGLPPHLICVAGQDPCRDEGIAYSEKLTENGVKNRLHIYPGVPHKFAEFDELEAQRTFHRDIVEGFKELLGN